MKQNQLHLHHLFNNVDCLMNVSGQTQSIFSVAYERFDPVQKQFYSQQIVPTYLGK